MALSTSKDALKKNNTMMVKICFPVSILISEWLWGVFIETDGNTCIIELDSEPENKEFMIEKGDLIRAVRVNYDGCDYYQFLDIYAKDNVILN